MNSVAIRRRSPTDNSLPITIIKQKVGLEAQMGREWYLTIRKFYVLHYNEYDSQLRERFVGDSLPYLILRCQEYAYFALNETRIQVIRKQPSSGTASRIRPQENDVRKYYTEVMTGLKQQTSSLSVRLY